MKEPIKMKAGDMRVLVNGRPLRVDFRIIAEENYQELLDTLKAKKGSEKEVVSTIKP